MSRSSSPGRLREWLPRGRTLPPEVWEQRHRWLLILLVVQVPALFVLGVLNHYGVGHTLWESSLPAIFAAVAAMPRFGRRPRSCFVSVGLLTCSALLVHFTGGLIEAHFHFFVMIPLLALYEDWGPFGLAFGYVLLHHGIAGAIDPSSVYNHPAAIAHPWRWAAIHAFFVAGAAFASVLAWRLNERARAAAQQAEGKLVAEQFASEHRLQLLHQAAQLNDDVVQAMVIAKMARRAGRDEESNDALEEALAKTRHIVTELMVGGGSVRPGDLRRVRTP
jgi:hypothetical protein